MRHVAQALLLLSSYIAVGCVEGFAGFKQVSDGINSHDPRVACFSDQSCLAIFEEEETTGGRAVQVKKSNNMGATWEASKVTLASNSPNDDPKISCIEPRGKKICAVVWGQYDLKKVIISVSMDGGNTWGTAQELDFLMPDNYLYSPGVSCHFDDSLPQSVVVEDFFSCEVAVRSYPTDRILVMSTQDGGKTFSTPVRVTSQETSGLITRAHRIECLKQSSMCHVTFIGYDDQTNGYVYTSSKLVSSSTWSSPILVPLSQTTLAIQSSSPVVVKYYWPTIDCVPGTNTCVLFCEVRYFDTVAQSSSRRSIEVSRTTNGGATWEALKVVHAHPQASLIDPAVDCYGSSSTCVAIWESQGDANTREPFYTISTNAGETWSSPAKFSLPVLDTTQTFYSDGEVFCVKKTGCIALWRARAFQDASDPTISIISSNLVITVSPTLAPTNAPSSSPTLAPSLGPTVSPTSGPTGDPDPQTDRAETSAPSASSSDANSNPEESSDNLILFIGAVSGGLVTVMLLALFLRRSFSKRQPRQVGVGADLDFNPSQETFVTPWTVASKASGSEFSSSTSSTHETASVVSFTSDRTGTPSFAVYQPHYPQTYQEPPKGRRVFSFLSRVALNANERPVSSASTRLPDV